MTSRRQDLVVAGTALVGALLVWLGWWLSQVPPDE